jgi:hypothetical protein
MTNRKMYGLDSETPMGKLRCLATNEEVIEPSSFGDVVDFLCQHKYRGAIMWLFNMRYDVEHILKMTNDRAFLEEIYAHGVQRPGIEYMGCKIQYIQGKLFKICKNGGCVTFYDIAQFYNGASLEKASKQYLPEKYWKKHGTEGIDARRIGEEAGYYESNRADVLKYCKQDALATLQLAKIIEDTFTNEGISFRNPISQAKISEVYVTDHYQYPKIPKGLEEAHEWAHQSYHGGLFWTLQRGYFRQPLYSYDINSAYPAVMVTLPH